MLLMLLAIIKFDASLLFHFLLDGKELFHLKLPSVKHVS